MKTFQYFACFCMSLFLSISTVAQTTTFEASENYSSFVKKQMQIDQIPGLSIGFEKENVRWSQGYGFADLENNVPAKPESAYRLASNTKSMTAVAILNLYEENKLDLDDPVRKYVPYFPRKDWEISIRQLLGHLGGVSHYKNYEVEGSIKEEKDTRESIEIFDEFELIAKPGTEYNYTSYGYNLLGAVIEGAAKTTYNKYLHQKIWEPLQMDYTFMDHPGAIIPNRVQGYQLKFGELKNSEFVNISSRFASGGVISTVGDLLNYARGLNEGKILSQNSISMMETSMSTTNGKLTDYGMGWRVEPVNGHFMVYHTGGQPETRTILYRFPELEFNIACAYNLEGGNLYAFPRRLYQLVMNEAWNIQPYTGNKYDKELISGIYDVYNYGLAYYERHQHEMPGSEEQLKKMFTFLNNTLNPDSLQNNFDEVKAKINLGRHPKAQMSYVRIGSFMAKKLSEAYGKEKMHSYHKNGAIPFFLDYIDLSKSFADASYAINSSMEQRIFMYYQDWAKCWNEYSRTIWFAPFEEISAKLEKLASMYSGRGIYPDFTKEIAVALWKGALKDDPDRQLPAAKKFVSVYPESAIPQLMLVNIYVLKNMEDEAKRHMELALRAKTDRHIVSAERVNYYITRMFQEDKLDEAMLYLKVAQEFYPESAFFKKTKGDIYMEKSRRAYKNALELNPVLEEAWKQLKDIE